MTTIQDYPAMVVAVDENGTVHYNVFTKGGVRALFIPAEWPSHFPVPIDPPVDPPFPPLPDVPPVTLTPESADFDELGGAGVFDVAVTGEGVSGTWIVEPEAEATWLTLDSPITPQTQSGPVSYTVAPGLEARVGHFYINGKTFTVNQTGPMVEDSGDAGDTPVAASAQSAPKKVKRW
jgi:hypothetical protein